MQAKVKVSHIPYKGSAPSVVSLVAVRRISAFYGGDDRLAAQRRQGARAGRGAHRAPAGHAQRAHHVGGRPQGLHGRCLVPGRRRRAPKPIVDRLYDEIAKALPAPDVKAKLDSMGVLATGMDPQGIGPVSGSEVEKWRGVISDRRYHARLIASHQ